MEGAAEGEEEGEDSEDESDEDSGDEEEQQQHQGGVMAAGTAAGAARNGTGEGDSSNRCDLLWQGQLSKRGFTGFKFHESKSAYAARKMLEAKNVGHYWDMLEKADQSLASSQLLEF